LIDRLFAYVAYGTVHGAWRCCRRGQHTIEMPHPIYIFIAHIWRHRPCSVQGDFTLLVLNDRRVVTADFDYRLSSSIIDNRFFRSSFE